MGSLFTAPQREQLLANCGQDDPFPVVKLFTPFANCTWLLTEIDPDNEDYAFGLCDLGMGFPELGYVDLGDIRSVGVERDIHFTPNMTISDYADQAHRKGYIVA